MCSFLLQIIFTPPVEAESWEICPSVMVSSNSARKDEARACLCSEKAFLAPLVSRSCLMGNFLGERVSSDDERWGFGVLRGEYSSFHSLMMSCCQNWSMLGRCGVRGIRCGFLGDAKPRGFGSGLLGGVANRVSLETFLGLFSDGELREGIG